MNQVANKAITWFFCFVYAIALSLVYVTSVFPEYEYMGFQLNEAANNYSAAAIALLSSLLVLAGPSRIDKPSQLFCVLTYLLVYVPTVNVGYFAVKKATFEYSEFFLVYTVCMLAIFVIARRKLKFFSAPGLSPIQYWMLFFALMSGCFGLVISYYKPDFSALISMEDIVALYDIRLQYREAGKEIPALVNYMFSWLAKLFWPMILLIGLSKGSKLLVVGAFFGFLSLFAISGHKSILLGYFAVVGFWYLAQRGDGLQMRKIAAIACAIVLLGLVFQHLGSAMLNNIFVRRVMIVPGVLSAFYYDFFSVHDYAYLGYSVFSGLVDYNYSASPPFVIGSHYFGRHDMSANANFIAAGYSEFGAIGAIGFAVLAALFYGVLDRLAVKKNAAKIVMLLAIVPTWALVDGSFLTVLLTHGLLGLLFAVYFLPTNSLKRVERGRPDVQRRIVRFGVAANRLT